MIEINKTIKDAHTVRFGIQLNSVGVTGGLPLA